MDLVLCHQTADFDALGAAVGLTRLRGGAKIVLTGGMHPGVKNFLALYRDEFPLLELRSVNSQKIERLMVVDTQGAKRLGKAAAWLTLPHLQAIEVYDHHLNIDSDIPATLREIVPLGAITTLIVEKLKEAGLTLAPAEATVMALGIHVDTGSLTFDQTTPRDGAALTWLMGQGANIAEIRAHVDQGLSPRLQKLLSFSLETLQTREVKGYTIAWVELKTEGFMPGLSGVAARLVDLTESDGLLLGAEYSRREGGGKRVTVIGRSRIPHTDLNSLFEPLGGGGHPQAASLTLRGVEMESALNLLVEQFIAQIPAPLKAADIMSAPVRTIRPQTTISEAQRILLRYGHSGLSVVDDRDHLVGIIARRDLDLALHHGFERAPVKGYMSRNLHTITPETSTTEIETLMVTYDVGRLPVLANGHLVGIVTRTDILRQRQAAVPLSNSRNGSLDYWSRCIIPRLQEAIAPPFWELLQQITREAQQRGLQLYLVGGAVRDLVLWTDSQTNHPQQATIQDLDLVVDGAAGALTQTGVELAKAMLKLYPQARLDIHGAFQTAALLWHKDPVFGSLAIDIATARTEFYPYPAANPEVEASSIHQDLYRRDFTINALALRLTQPREGELLDYFGGLEDLRSRLIRVLHANSFIEDPTRIYRAVRFAVRLGFTIEPQTEDYIRYALASGVYNRSRLSNKAPALTTRLKVELKYILEAPYWRQALTILNNLDALRCIHPTLTMTPHLWRQIRGLDRGLRQFDPQYHLPHWQLRLELLLTELGSAIASQIADDLQLAGESVKRLEELERSRIFLITHLPSCEKPSQIVQLLRPYKLGTLVLLTVKIPRNCRRILWQYLTHWSQITPPLNGDDLKQLGLKPGPLYGQILDDLLTATLDGTLKSRTEAIAFLEKNFKLKMDH